MDEPLASLDPARKSEVIPFIGKLPAALSIPILYVTHSIEEVLHLADAIVLMDCGRSVAVGKLQEVIWRPEFQEVVGRQRHSQWCRWSSRPMSPPPASPCFRARMPCCVCP